MLKTIPLLLFSCVALMAGPVRAAEPRPHDQAPFEMAQACGWYAIVGCARSWNGASSIAPPGTYVIDTNQYPNFRNGWFCAADGPYATRGDVPLWKWQQFRSDAYVKSAC